jgi:catechol 2,3-dioxygenase-like lactoylglutathione lyase family enzyme
MITQIRHSGIVIIDSKKAFIFWCEIMKLKIVVEKQLSNEFCNKLLCAKNGGDVSIRYTKLSNENLSTMIELYEMTSISDNLMPNFLNSLYGYNHIAITVDNIDALYEEIKIKGFDILSESVIIDEEGRNKLFFCRDGNGNLVEIVEPIIIKE